MTDFEALRWLAPMAGLTDEEIAWARELYDYSESEPGFLEARKPSHSVPQLTDDEVRALISDEARTAIVVFEITSESYYKRNYEYPILPGVSSGITVGIGYDLGYNTPAAVRRDFDGLIAPADIETLTKVCGLKGAKARPHLPSVKHVRVPVEAAREVFRRATLPRFGRSVLETFPNAIELHGHCFGMLLSLVFNRGTDLVGKPGDDRRREMKAIHDLMAERRWSGIPQQYRAMKRIWKDDPKAKGVVLRREAEAKLFERGLEMMQAATAASLESAGLEALHTQDPALERGDGNYVSDDTEELETLERARSTPEKVVWPKDDRAPDYAHIPDRSLSGTVFHLGPAELELLFEVNSFSPARDSGRIVFALRGAELVSSKENPARESRQENRTHLTVRDSRPDHRSFRCIIGVYDVERARLYGYPSSTVPNAKTVAKHVANISSANMMLTGCYTFTVGWHLRGANQKDRTIPGCLIENDRYKAVLRTSRDHILDVADDIDNRAPFGDNLHPGLSDPPLPFSSAGCQVVSGTVEPRRNGDRTKVRHVGEWARFRRALGLPDTGTGGHGTHYDYVLLTGLDAAIAHDVIEKGLDPRGAAVKAQLHRLRQGSRGPRVARLNAQLDRSGPNIFDHRTAKRLGDLQRARMGAVFGIYGPQMDGALGLEIFKDESQVATLERRGVDAALERRSHRDQLALELGAEYEAHRGVRNLSSDARHEGLLAAVGELGTKALVSTGNVLMRQAELTLKRYVCEHDAIGDLVDRDAIRQRVDTAARISVTALKHALVWALRQATFSFAPTELLERVVDYILDEIILPGSGDAGAAFVGRLDGGVAWLCTRWSKSIEDRYSDAISTRAPAPEYDPAAHDEPPETEYTTPAQPVGSACTSAADPELARLLQSIEAAADGDGPDVAGVRSYIHRLRDHMRKTGQALTPEQHRRLLDILCDSRLMEHIAGAVGRDPYILMDDIDGALSEIEVDRAKVESRVRELCDVLADARLPLQAERVERTIKALRKRRLPEQVSLLADRVLTRDPNAAMLGRIGPHYALSLIDSHRIVAGIDVLQTTLERGQLSADASAEAWGGLGRAHKQIYVNHVRSHSDASALRSTMAPQLAQAIDAYSYLYDPAHPDVNYWHGINLVALLRRAAEDRAGIGSRLDPEDLARSIVAALEPGISGTADHYRLATLGEAYLALDEPSQAARYYAEFAAHEATDAFALKSAIRQLQEVWRLEAGTDGAGTLLIGLKAALAQKDGGRITLTANERRTIANSTSARNQEAFESKIKGGKFVPFDYLKRVVMTGMAVAAIKQKPARGGSHASGAGATVGTGFLVEAAPFGLAADRSYLLTNAHVLWDPDLGQGAENMAISPQHAEIVFEGADGQVGACGCAEIIWQSPSGLYDACLIALDKHVTQTSIRPLAVAGANILLQPDDGSGKSGTSLAIVGHPQGGALSVGFSGSLEEICARLVDKGPKGNSSRPVFLHYSVPTEPGNSGSPVLETSDWRVVGLHHAGFDEVHGRARLGQNAGTHHANEGICIQSISQAMREHRQGASKRKRKGFFR